MDSLSVLLKKMTMNSFDEGSEHSVYITHINDPSNFYVRLIDTDPHLPELVAKDKRFHEKEIHLRSEVIYKSKTINSDIRGQIWFINSHKSYDIFAQDFGWVDKNVPLKDIYKPLYKHLTPPLAIPCSLAVCKPLRRGAWPEDSIKAMKIYCTEKRAKIVVRTAKQNNLEVVLYNILRDDIGSILLKTGYAFFGYDPKNVGYEKPSSSKKIYQYKKLAIGDQLRVIMQHRMSLNEFYVAQINEFKEYQDKRVELDYFSNNQDPVTADDVIVGMPVAAKLMTDLKYERSIITSISALEESAGVYFVDCGCTDTVPISELKPITEPLFFVNPPVSIFCRIGKISHKALFKFSDLSPGYEFIIKIMAIGDSFKKPYVIDVTLI